MANICDSFQLLSGNGNVTFYDLDGMMISCHGLYRATVEFETPFVDVTVMGGATQTIHTGRGEITTTLKFASRAMGSDSFINDLRLQLHDSSSFHLLLVTDTDTLPEYTFYDCMLSYSVSDGDSNVVFELIVGSIESEE